STTGFEGISTMSVNSWIENAPEIGALPSDVNPIARRWAPPVISPAQRCGVGTIGVDDQTLGLRDGLSCEGYALGDGLRACVELPAKVELRNVFWAGLSERQWKVEIDRP